MNNSEGKPIMKRPKTDATDNMKVFNDPIHGMMQMEPCLVAVIDTPAFQRLRKIKQLELADRVFPGATHTRFEHSLGVAHLAGKMCEELRKDLSLEIDDKDAMCVKLAGLCHDLGHGPFSHSFQSIVMHKVAPELNWKHEQASKMMFDHILEIDVKSEKRTVKNMFMEDWGFEDIDFTFVKELISSDPRNRKGRTGKKACLYGVVANEETGIDVDKWDYFQRDCHYLGLVNSFQYQRLLQNMRVMEVDEHQDGNKQWRICYRDKVWQDILHMFQVRQRYHYTVYQHRVTNNIRQMVTDALILANNHVHFTDPTGQGSRVKMTEAHANMNHYVQLNDSIWDLILHKEHSGISDLQKAQRLLERVEKREFYQTLATIVWSNSDYEFKEEEFLKSVLGQDYRQEDFAVSHRKLDYGKKGLFPLDNCWFFKKGAEEPTSGKALMEEPAFQQEGNLVIPKVFYQRSAILLWTCDEPCSEDRKREVLDRLEKWVNEENSPQENQDMMIHLRKA